MFGNPDPPVLTSVKFGVSKRQKDDPPPEFYNLYNPTSSTSSTTSATSTSTSSSQGTSTAVAETTAAFSIPSTADNSSGRTVAQKVGIGLGVPLGVLAMSIIGALIFLYRRRSRRARGLDETPNSNESTPSVMVGAAKDTLDTRMSRAETVIAELPSPSFDTEGIEEVSNHRPVSEIMGTPRNELGA